VKRGLGRVTVLMFVVLGLVFTSGNLLAQSAEQQERPDLNETVKWAVWHEGCRIYAADNSIGDVEEIRECIVGVNARNEEAQQLVRDAKPAALTNALRTAAREIPGERQLNQFIEYACKHEQLLDKFYDLENAGDYEAMRSLYFDTFKDNEKARNLLAAVSNEAMCDLINVLR
jgi:hypothetical protein